MKITSLKNAKSPTRWVFGVIVCITVVVFLLSSLSGCEKSGITSSASKIVTPTEYSLLFVSDSTGNQEISIMDLSTKAVRNLSNNQASDNSPSWWAARSRIVFGSGRSGQGDIYSMKQDGTDQTLLVGGTNIEQSPMVSPDGKWLVYVQIISGKPSIRVRDLTTNAEVVVGSGYNPAWSSDNRRVAFDSAPTGGATSIKEAIFIVDTQIASPKAGMIPHPSQSVSGYVEPFWHPDGKSLLYSTGLGANRGLYLQDLTSKTGRTISDGLGQDRFPSLSPDGKYIACISNLSEASAAGLLERFNPSERSWAVVLMQVDNLAREKFIQSGVILDRPVWVKTAALTNTK